MKLIKLFLLMVIATPSSQVFAKTLNCFLKVNSKNLVLSNILIESGVIQNANGAYRSQYYLNNNKTTQIVVTHGADRFIGMTTTTDVGVEELNYWVKHGDDVIVSGCKLIL